MLALGGTWYNTGDGFENESNIKLGYEGNYLSLNTAMDSPSGGGGGSGGDTTGTIQLPGMMLSGQHNQWGQAFQNAFNAMMKEWNAKSDFAWDRMVNAGRYNDGPIQYVGGAGDPTGVWEVGGMALSAMSGGKGNYILAALMITRSGNTTGLKMLAAERGILEAETGALINNSPLKNISGNLDEAASLAKNQPYGSNTNIFRRLPKTAQDVQALSEAQQGMGRNLNLKLGDPRYQGWEKWHHSVGPKGGKSVVHYLRDPKTGLLTDFKFK